jgi:hypothetical protein
MAHSSHSSNAHPHARAACIMPVGCKSQPMDRTGAAGREICFPGWTGHSPRAFHRFDYPITCLSQAASYGGKAEPPVFRTFPAALLCRSTLREYNALAGPGGFFLFLRFDSPDDVNFPRRCKASFRAMRQSRWSLPTGSWRLCCMGRGALAARRERERGTPLCKLRSA